MSTWYISSLLSPDRTSTVLGILPQSTEGGQQLPQLWVISALKTHGEVRVAGRQQPNRVRAAGRRWQVMVAKVRTAAGALSSAAVRAAKTEMPSNGWPSSDQRARHRVRRDADADGVPPAPDGYCRVGGHRLGP
jgi:hypothetical protein